MPVHSLFGQRTAAVQRTEANNIAIVSVFGRFRAAARGFAASNMQILYQTLYPAARRR